MPLFSIVAPANGHDAPFARARSGRAVRLYRPRPRVVRLDAASWGLALVRRLHAVPGAVAAIPWDPRRQKNRACVPPTWTAAEPGKRGSIARSCGRVVRCFGPQRPPVCGWTAVAQRVARTYTAAIVVGLAAQQAGRPDRIRSPKRVLAHLWAGEMD